MAVSGNEQIKASSEEGDAEFDANDLASSVASDDSSIEDGDPNISSQQPIVNASHTDSEEECMHDEDRTEPVALSPTKTPSLQRLVQQTEKNGDRNHGSTDLFWDAEEGKSCCETMPVTKVNVPPFWRAGLQRKTTAFSAQPWASLSLTLDGRDKITKVLQYLCRFLGWYLTGKSGPMSKRFTSLYKSLATSRKAFRMGRSFVEVQKLRTMGLAELVLWHMKSHFDQVACDERKQESKPKLLVRHASSNIGWGPPTIIEERQGREEQWRRPLYRSLSSMAYRRMYHPLVSSLSQSWGKPIEQPRSTELWKAFGTALKMVGLFGFWAGDNVNFLCSSGFMDNFALPDKERVARRKSLQTIVSRRANQAYFMGALAGLFVSWKSYWNYQSEKLQPARKSLQGMSDEDSDETKQTMRAFTKLQEREFSLFLALLKSCCDVMVFSNNPGIDLHKKLRGRKNYEGFHCMCGLISAGTVLYNNFPDAK